MFKWYLHDYFLFNWCFNAKLILIGSLKQIDIDCMLLSCQINIYKYFTVTYEGLFMLT